MGQPTRNEEKLIILQSLYSSDQSTIFYHQFPNFYHKASVSSTIRPHFLTFTQLNLVHSETCYTTFFSIAQALM